MKIKNLVCILLSSSVLLSTSCVAIKQSSDSPWKEDSNHFLRDCMVYNEKEQPLDTKNYFLRKTSYESLIHF